MVVCASTGEKPSITQVNVFTYYIFLRSQINGTLYMEHHKNSLYGIESKGGYHQAAGSITNKLTIKF
jgi:hypothetical protein